MKNKLCLSFLLFIMCNICLYAQAQVQMIDQAIIASAVRISRELPANATAAIIDFSSASSELNNHVVKELHGAILRHRRIVPVTPNQSQIQNISLETRFSSAGVLTDESAQTIGRLLGVQYLITGTIEPFSAHHRLIFNVVETANTKNRSQYTAAVDIRNDIQLTLLISDLRNLISGTQSNRPVAPVAPVAPAAPAVERVPTVTDVKISHEDSSFLNGGRYRFSATVEGTDNPPQDVIWSVEGSTSEKTVISSKGVLAIADDETGTELTIQAVSQFDSKISGSVEIMVTIVILPPPKNRLSGEASVLGAGLRYERSLNDIFSLGANIFWQTFNDSVDFGVLASARLFPGDSIFFLELGLGYGYMERIYLYKFQGYDILFGERMMNGSIIYKNSGFMINPVIGLSFSRKTRGFLTDVFFSVPILLGERDIIEGNVDAGLRFGIGLGGSW